MIFGVCILLFFNSAAFAATGPAGDASSLPLSGYALWNAVVGVFTNPDGKVDLETLKSTLHYDPAATDPADREHGVYWGAIGADNKIGFRFNLWANEPQPWGIYFFWLDKAHPLKSGGLGAPLFCIGPEQIEADFLAAGWEETHSYGQYKSVNGSLAVTGVLPVLATFKKGNVDLYVSLDRAGECFYYLSASPRVFTKN